MQQRVRLTEEERKRCHSCAQRFTRLSVTVSLMMAAVKYSVGVLTGSRALTASALYSVNDAFSAVIAIVSLKMAGRPADSDYPYGRGKVEFLAIAGMSVTLAGGVFLVLFESIGDITRGVKAAPHLVAGGVAILVGISNWVLAKRGFCCGHKLNSPTLHNSAEHAEADALSSVAVLVGVVGGAFGFHSLDQYVAIFETIHLLALSGAMLGRSINGFLDHALPEAEARKIYDACARTPGVLGVGGVKTRMHGGQVIADIVVVVSSGLSVSGAHAICEQARAAVLNVSSADIIMNIRFRPDDNLMGLEASLDLPGSHA
jgi:cation diffusion facilitator family transporter